jgi:hypothetical protein
MFFLHSTRAGNRGMRISSDGAQISAGGFHVTDSSLSTNIAGLDQTGRFTAAAGSAIAPAYRFNSTGESTGFYYVPKSIYSSDNYALDILNGVGLSINGKTALFVGRVGDTSGLTGSDECQMMLLQSVTNEGYVDYFLGVHDNLSGASTPGVFSIGKVNDTSNSYSTALAIVYKTDEIRSNYSFRTTKQIIGKNQSLVVDEAAPAFAFTNATNTGMFYVDYWDNDAGVTFSNGVGFSINGKAAFVVTRDSSVTSNAITAGVMMPLILNQSVQNTNEVYYDFIASDSEAGGSQVGGMRFGFIEYTSAFNPVLSLINAGSQSYIDVNADMNFTEYEHVLKFVDSVSINAGGVYFTSASQKLGVDSNSIYIGDLGTSSVKVVRASKSIELTGTTTINAASGISNATLNFNYGNDGAISVSGTGMLISYGSSNSDSAKIGWGYSGVQRGFLSASGFVFAQRNDAGVSYGFSASNGNAVPNVGIGTSATGMVFYGDVNSSGAFTNTATSTFNHLIVTGTISIPGTLNIAGLTTGSLQATSIYVPFSTTTTTTIMNTLEFTTAVGVAKAVTPYIDYIHFDLDGQYDVFRSVKDHPEKCGRIIIDSHHTFDTIERMIDALYVKVYRHRDPRYQHFKPLLAIPLEEGRTGSTGDPVWHCEGGTIGGLTVGEDGYLRLCPYRKGKEVNEIHISEFKEGDIKEWKTRMKSDAKKCPGCGLCLPMEAFLQRAQTKKL